MDSSGGGHLRRELGELLEKARPKLRAKASRMLGASSDVEEVVQETIARFLQATQKMQTSWSEVECTSYLMTALSSCVIDYCRKSSSRRRGETELSNVVSIREQLNLQTGQPGITKREFQRALDQLTAGQSAAFVMLCEGLSYGQIAERLNTTPNAVGKRIFDARAVLARNLGIEGHGESNG